MSLAASALFERFSEMSENRRDWVAEGVEFELVVPTAEPLGQGRISFRFRPKGVVKRLVALADFVRWRRKGSHLTHPRIGDALLWILGTVAGQDVLPNHGSRINREPYRREYDLLAVEVGQGPAAAP